VQLLTGHLEDVLEQTMVERIVGTAREVEAIQGPVEFLQKFGEASRLLGQLPGRADEVAVELFKLHRRHARQVNGVLDHEIAARFGEGRWEDLPPTCLLRVLASRSAAPRPLEVPRRSSQLKLSPHVPTEEDWNILLALAQAEHTLVQEDLRARLNPKLSRRTLGKRLNIMRRYSLVRYPNGPRKGVALGDAGRVLVEHSPHRPTPERAH
jgi:hypothetical protein